MTGPVLYVAEVDYPPEQLTREGGFTAWYANRHAPDLIRAGFRTATSYRAVVGGMAALNLYEVPDTSVFAGAAYKAALPGDPYAPAVRNTSAGRARAQTAYIERVAKPADAGPMNADWISLARFGLPEPEDASLIAWLNGDLHDRLAPLGAKRVRLATRTIEKIGAGTHRPRCIVVAEWAVQPPAEASLLPLLQDRFGTGVADADEFMGWRAYPWPDRPRP